MESRAQRRGDAHGYQLVEELLERLVASFVVPHCSA